MVVPDAHEPRAGRLLVATLLIGDPNFDRSVVLLLEHNDEGSLGVVLNRPTELEVAAALPAWAQFTGDPAVIFEGGPVAAGGVLALGRAGSSTPTQGWAPLPSGLATVDLSREPEDLGGDVAGLRLFSGYAGWGPDQLQGEIDVGAWWVLDANPGDAFSAVPTELWWDVLRRQGDAYRLYLHAPSDVSVN